VGCELVCGPSRGGQFERGKGGGHRSQSGNSSVGGGGTKPGGGQVGRLKRKLFFAMLGVDGGRYMAANVFAR